MQHIIQSGETLSRIAAAHGTTLQRLLEANPQYRADPDRIRVGELVQIPNGAAPGLADAAPPAFTPPPAPGSSAACRASTRPAGAAPARSRPGSAMPGASPTAATR